MKRIALSVVGVITLILSSVYGSQFFNNGTNRAILLYDKLKSQCRVVDVSPYENRELGIKFAFDANVVACDRSMNAAGDEREIYLWKRAAFVQSMPMPFSESIVGEVLVSHAEHLAFSSDGEGGEEVSNVAGVSTTVKLIRPQGCEYDCPQARMAELKRGTYTFRIEEYAPDVGLLRSFEFID
jgi:hypothetical protein